MELPGDCHGTVMDVGGYVLLNPGFYSLYIYDIYIALFLSNRKSTGMSYIQHTGVSNNANTPSSFF